MLSIPPIGRGDTGLTQQNGSLPAPSPTSTSESSFPTPKYPPALPAHPSSAAKASPAPGSLCCCSSPWHQPWLPKCLCKSWEDWEGGLSPPLGPKKLLGNGHSAATGERGLVLKAKGRLSAPLHGSQEWRASCLPGSEGTKLQGFPFYPLCPFKELGLEK